MNVVIVSFTVAMFWAVAAIFQKFYLQNVSVQKAMFISSVTLLICVLVMSCFYPKEVFNTPSKNKDILFIIAATVIGWFFAYYFLFYALKNYKVSDVMSLSYVSPLIVLVLAYFLLKEPISKSAILGTILIVSGAVFVARR